LVGKVHHSRFDDLGITPEVVHWKGNDGLPIAGILYKPAGVQYLVSAGLADPKRVGISGGSHGGTVVANAVTKYPDVFAVGIEKFGVVDRALFLQYTHRNSAIRWETKMGHPSSCFSSASSTWWQVLRT
jgi:dipeptidyl aminopeptidase/acylaminoacyl peptidase